MIYTLKIFFLFFLTVFINTVFSDLENPNWIIEIKTIKELKQEVENINEQKENTEIELNELKKELLVKRFFRVNFTNDEKNQLTELIKNYRNKKEFLNTEIILKSRNLKDTAYLKRELLLNEKFFYWELVNFIDLEKKDKYIEYIRKNIIIVNRKSNLKSSIAKKEVILQKRVDNIKEKIKQHNKQTSNNTVIIVNNKLNYILLNLTQKEKFINLSKEWQYKLFDTLIKRIDNKLDFLDKKTNKSKTQEIIIDNREKIIENIKIFRDKALKWK